VRNLCTLIAKTHAFLVAKLCKISVFVSQTFAFYANLSKIYAFKLQRCCAFRSNATLSIQLQEKLRNTNDSINLCEIYVLWLQNVCVLVAKLCKIYVFYLENFCVLNANLSKIYAFRWQRCCAFWGPIITYLVWFRIYEYK